MRRCAMWLLLALLFISGCGLSAVPGGDPPEGGVQAEPAAEGALPDDVRGAAGNAAPGSGEEPGGGADVGASASGGEQAAAGGGEARSDAAGVDRAAAQGDGAAAGGEGGAAGVQGSPGAPAAAGTDGGGAKQPADSRSGAGAAGADAAGRAGEADAPAAGAAGERLSEPQTQTRDGVEPNSVLLSIVGDADKGVILAPVSIELREGDTVIDVLKRAGKANSIPLEARGSGMFAYVEGIANLYEFDNGPESGWLFRVNGELSGKGAGVVKVSEGDVIEWLYTTDLGQSEQ